jgi:hypothetical protein
VFLFGFLHFLGAKCPLRPIFPLRFILIATLLQHLEDFTWAKVESLKELMVRVQKLKSAIEIGGHGSLSFRLSLTQIVNDLRDFFKSKN